MERTDEQGEVLGSSLSSSPSEMLGAGPSGTKERVRGHPLDAQIDGPGTPRRALPAPPKPLTAASRGERMPARQSGCLGPRLKPRVLVGVWLLGRTVMVLYGSWREVRLIWEPEQRA